MRGPLRRGGVGILAALTVAAVSCALALVARGCANVAACASAMVTPERLALAAVLVVGAAVAVTTSAWAIRVALLVTAADREAGRLMLVEPNDTLAAAMRRTGVTARCLATDRSVAFCTGAWRPRIHVAKGLGHSLRSDELDAVLLHEAAHARRRDPLRRAMWRAASDLLVPFPVVRCLAERAIEAEELAADRAAIRCLGPEPVAGALLSLAADVSPATAAAFGGCADARVAQLLGEPHERTRISAVAIAATGTAVVLHASLVACLSPLVAKIL
jgi:beta-lactamase regulating signal transducer with metallopeptidase domain